MVNNNTTLNDTMTKRLGFGLGFLFVIAVFSACAQENGMVLELKDVQFFKAQQINSLPVTIKLSGLAFHSSLVVREMTTSQDHESLQFLVYLTPATGKLSGNFDYTLAIPASINTVSFGKEKVVIWNRSTGIVTYAPN